MTDITSIARSGLQATELRVNVSASNIVNANTPNYKPKDVDATANSDGSVSAKVVDRQPASITVTNGDGTTTEFPNVSVDQELVSSQVARYDFKAEAKLLEVQRDLNKRLLDIQA